MKLGKVTWVKTLTITLIVAFLIIGQTRNSKLASRVQVESKAEPMSNHFGQTTSLSRIMQGSAETWHGIRQVPVGDLQDVAENLGGTVIAMGVGTLTADKINDQLDLAQSLGYQALIIMYTEETCSKRPWEWNGSTWEFPQPTIETLQGIAHHPAILAIYALHEPFDTTHECHWSVEQQQELYQLLKTYTDGLPVWSDLTGLAIWENRDVELVDGICDYCGTNHHRFRSDWTSERCLEEILDWINADLDTQRRLMPSSRVVFHVQTFAYYGYSIPLRLPSPDELTTVRDHLCALNQPMMYYPWSHGLYDLTLEDAPQLWPVVSMGCPRVFLPLILTGVDRTL